MRALAAAFLFLLSCSKFEKHESAPPPSTTPSAAADAGADASRPYSAWSEKSRDALELVASPDRGAVLVYVDGGYVLQRGEAKARLPREWFGAGPPRRDLSISADGRFLVVPLESPAASEGAAVIRYDTGARRFAGRFALPKNDVPDGGEATGKISADGKSIVWTAPGRPCMATDVESAKLEKCK